MHRLKKLDNLYLLPPKSRAKAITYSPAIYVETRLDLNDVRTGYKDVVPLAQALKIYSDQTMQGWTEETILDVDMDRITEVPPRVARLQPLPEFVDDNFVQGMETRYAEYLSRTWTVRIYRNTGLNIYSGAGESREEFVLRCRDLLEEQLRADLNRLHTLFSRKQEQLREKYVGPSVEEADVLEPELPRPQTSAKDIFQHYAKRLDALFMGAGPDGPAAQLQRNSELEERLVPLEEEARQAIAGLREGCDTKASQLDEYLLHPNMKDIRCDRSCILWMPAPGKEK
jgi:hypothetical protein